MKRHQNRYVVVKGSPPRAITRTRYPTPELVAPPQQQQVQAATRTCAPMASNLSVSATFSRGSPGIPGVAVHRSYRLPAGSISLAGEEKRACHLISRPTNALLLLWMGRGTAGVSFEKLAGIASRCVIERTWETGTNDRPNDAG